MAMRLAAPAYVTVQKPAAKHKEYKLHLNLYPGEIFDGAGHGIVP